MFMNTKYDEHGYIFTRVKIQNGKVRVYFKNYSAYSLLANSPTAFETWSPIIERPLLQNPSAIKCFYFKIPVYCNSL